MAQFGMAQSKENRKISNFSELSVSGPFDVEIVQGNTESLDIQANSELLERIVTEVSGQKLKIYLKNQNGNWNWKNKWDNPKVYVSFKNLVAISASASADVVCERKFKADDLKLNASSAGDIKLHELTAKYVNCDTSSGADIVMAGSAEKLVANASSGADLKADKFVVQICRADASSGADIAIDVRADLEANASSGADIRYMGNPQKVRVNSSSGGSVRKKN